MKSLKEMKQNGRTLRKHLEAAFAQPVTLSQAYEALAVAVGSASWNALSAQAVATSQAPKEGAVPTANIGSVFGRRAAQNGGYFAASDAQAVAAPSAEGPRVSAIFQTVDGKVKRYFDATAWFEQASYEEIVELMEEIPRSRPREFASAYGGRDHGSAVADFFAGKDDGVDEVFAYIEALRDAGGDCGGSDCYINAPELDLWIGSRFDLRGQRIDEARHNMAYGRMVLGLNDDAATPAPSNSVRDVDLAEPANRELAKKLCAKIWADCVEEWKKPSALPCQYVIEHSAIFAAMSAFDIEGTDEEGGYSDEAACLVDDLLEKLGYYEQARQVFNGQAKINDPVEVEEVTVEPPQYSAKGRYNRMSIIEVNLVDVLNEYDVPDECPEWKWVEDNHRWAHKSNNAEPGVWEFMVNVDKHNPDLLKGVPAVLKPFFEEALRLDAPWIMFHQG
jgi:hypothetical protein